MRLIPRRMWVQMALVLAALTAVPLMLLGATLINTSQVAVETSVLRDQNQLARRTASELSELVRRPQDLLRSTAAILGTLGADEWKQETVLVQLALDHDIFGRIASVDLSGREKVSSELGSSLLSHASDPTFVSALQGTPHISEVRFFPDRLPYVSMAVPVRFQGQITGVLIADVRLRGFWDIVDAIRIGETGRAFVVSQKGVLVAGEDKKKVLANEDWSGDPSVKAALEGKTGSVEAGPWLKAYAPIEGVGWALVLRQSRDEAYSFLRTMKIEAWVLILISLGLALATSVFLARFLVSPIQVLARKMGLVAQGDFDQRVEESRQDEIGTLLRAFNAMAGKLKEARESEKLAVIGKASASIAHELKNSLILVSTFIGMLPEKKEDKQFLEKFSTVVPEELQGWKDMLDSIGDYSRRSKFELAVMRPDEFLSDFMFLVKQKMTDHDIRLSVDIQGNLPKVKGNPQKLKQAFLNIVLNAIQAMPGGGSFHIAASARDSAVLITFRDSGKGIPPDKLARIFEPFYSTKPNGLGLGLAVSQEILALHGGRLSVESRPGEGAFFSAELPALK